MACCEKCELTGGTCLNVKVPLSRKEKRLNAYFGRILDKSPHAHHLKAVEFGADPTHQNDSWVSDGELLEYGQWLDDKIQKFNTNEVDRWATDPPNSTGTRTLLLAAQWNKESNVICPSVDSMAPEMAEQRNCRWDDWRQRWNINYANFRDSYAYRIGGFDWLKKIHAQFDDYVSRAKKLGLPFSGRESFDRPPPEKSGWDNLSEKTDSAINTSMWLGIAALGVWFWLQRAPSRTYSSY